MAQLGDGLGSDWPSAIDTVQTYVNVASPKPDGPSRDDAEFMNDVLDAIRKIQLELGVNPSGASADVAARFSTVTQGAALSVWGVTGNQTADMASIAAGSDHQVLRRSGTTLAFGAVNLAQSAAVTGTLGLTNGGTNASLTAAAGGLLYSTASALAIQAAGVSGYFARSGGTGAPTWFDLFGSANTWTATQTHSLSDNTTHAYHINRTIGAVTNPGSGLRIDTNNSGVQGGGNITYADINIITEFAAASNFKQGVGVRVNVTSRSTTATDESGPFVGFNSAKGAGTTHRIWGGDWHVQKLNADGPADDALMVAGQFTVTKDPTEPAALNKGSYGAIVESSGATRSGTGVYIFGSAGWTTPLLVEDTNSQQIASGVAGTILFKVDQTGIVYTPTKIGVGRTAPETDVHIAKDANTFLMVGAATSGAPQAGLIGRTSRGTLASPTASQLNDDLLRLEGRGRGATGYTAAAKALIRLRAAEAWTDAAQGSSIDFEMTPIGSTTRAAVWRFSDVGHLLALTDNTYDIGASGANRPRALYLSGNAVIGGTITAGSSAHVLTTAAGLIDTTKFSLTWANGGIVYSTATGQAISAAGASGQILRSAGAAAPTWSTATYPATAGTAKNILESDGTNWVSAGPTQMVFAQNYAAVTLGGSSSSFLGFYNTAGTSTEANRQLVATRAGTLKRLYVVTSSAQSATGTLVFTVRLNGGNTSLVVTVAAGAAAGTYSDLSNTVAVAQGDLIGVVDVTNNATATSAGIRNISMLFDN